MSADGALHDNWKGIQRRTLHDRVLQKGREPDPRFTLANERTFLAWIRTSLVMLAGGIAVEAFTTDIFVVEVRTSLAVLLLSLALLIGGGAFFRWLNVEQAMRHAKPLPLPLITLILGFAERWLGLWWSSSYFCDEHRSLE